VDKSYVTSTFINRCCFFFPFIGVSRYGLQWDSQRQQTEIRRGAGKSLAFPIFLFAAQPKEYFLDGLKKLEQRSHKRVELGGEYIE
jgi:hypothetical protein